MTEEGIRGGLDHTIPRYAEANNKYIKIFQYLDANNIYGWAMSQKLPVDAFKWIKDTSLIDKKCNKFIRLIKNYDEGSNKEYILEVDTDFARDLRSLYNDLPFLSERMKNNRCHKFVCNLYDNRNYVVHIRAFKETLNHGLVLKKVRRAIEFNQEA